MEMGEGCVRMELGDGEWETVSKRQGGPLGGVARRQWPVPVFVAPRPMVVLPRQHRGEAEAAVFIAPRPNVVAPAVFIAPRPNVAAPRPKMIPPRQH